MVVSGCSPYDEDHRPQMVSTSGWLIKESTYGRSILTGLVLEQLEPVGRGRHGDKLLDFCVESLPTEGQSALAAKHNEPELKEADLSVMASRTYSVFWLSQSYVQRLGNMGGESALSLRAGHSTNGLLWAPPHQ